MRWLIMVAVLVSLTSCMTIREVNLKIEVPNGVTESTSAVPNITINVGNKTVSVPTNATVPLSALGL